MTPREAQAAGQNEPMDAESWDARLRSPLCTEGDRERFVQWLGSSSENAEAFDDLHAKIRTLKNAAPVDPRLRALVDKAALATRKHARHRWMIAATFCSAIGLGGALYLASQSLIAGTTTTYQTAAGERSTINLEDGSVVVLNARSELNVTYGFTTRALTLTSGEAMFTVAKERRPFVVTAGSRQVVAVGTAFDIRTNPRRVEVTMVHGKVNVTTVNSNHGQASMSLVAGQRMIVDDARRSVTVSPTDGQMETAWLDGHVQFDDTSLADAVKEMNRYTSHRILIGDADLGTLTINGSFRTSQPDNFVTAVTSYYPIDAVRAANGDVRLVHR